MNNNYTYKDFVEKLKKVFGEDLVATRNAIVFTTKNNKFKFSKIDFDKTIKSKANNIEEFPVEVQRGHIFRSDNFLVKDDKCSIMVTNVSDKKFISNFMTAKLEHIRMRFFWDYDENKLPFLEYLKGILLIQNASRYAVKLIKNKNFSGEPINLVESYLINLSINKNIVLTLKNEDESNTPFISQRIGIHPANSSSIEMPKRKYNSEISRSFQMAKASNNPMLEYLSYYHVLEYFFSDIYDNYVIKQLRDIITSPDFSYKSDKCYKRILSKVQKHYTFDEGRGAVKIEKKALRLVLEEYINLENLFSFLNNDDGIYYKNNPSAFEEKQKTIINPDDSDNEMFAAITNRVYSTRNALVHSKDNNLISFVPFRDEFKITLEMPLIRFLAKEVLINSSEII